MHLDSQCPCQLMPQITKTLDYVRRSYSLKFEPKVKFVPPGDAASHGGTRIWNLEFGAWNLELGIWSLEFGSSEFQSPSDSYRLCKSPLLPCSLFPSPLFLVPLFLVPCSLFLVPCSLFPVPCSLFPCSLFLVPVLKNNRATRRLPCLT